LAAMILFRVRVGVRVEVRVRVRVGVRVGGRGESRAAKLRPLSCFLSYAAHLLTKTEAPAPRAIPKTGIPVRHLVRDRVRVRVRVGLGVRAGVRVGVGVGVRVGVGVGGRGRGRVGVGVRVRVSVRHQRPTNRAELDLMTPSAVSDGA